MKDLISIFSRKQDWDRVLILTYALDPVTFFETQLLNHLTVRNNLTVVLDAANLRQLLSSDNQPRYAGVFYNLEGVTLSKGGHFHPKLYLFASNEEVYAVIGSFNLTYSGFKQNIETVTEMRFIRGKMSADDASLLCEIGTFLRKSFVDKNALVTNTSECLRLSIEDLLASQVFMEASAAGVSQAAKNHFLSSIDASLFEQIKKFTKLSTFKKTKALSPFFDEDAKALKQLSSVSKKVELYIPGTKSTFPSELFASDLALQKIPVSTVKDIDHNRFCHAKLYRFEGQTQSWGFLTSANLSAAGLINQGATRNLEIGVLFPDNAKNAFPGIPGVTLSPVTDFAALSLLQRLEKTSDEPRTPPPEHWISEAYYNSGVIQFRVMPDDKPYSHCEALLSANACPPRVFAVEKTGLFYKFQTDLEIEGSATLTLVLKSTVPVWQTDPFPVGRRIHQPNQLPALGASAFERCRQKGGEEGVAEAFLIAKTSGKEDWLYYLLQRWDLDRIYQGVLSQDGDVLPDEEGNSNTPSLPTRASTDYTIKKVQKNLGFLVDKEKLYERFDDFTKTIAENTDKDALRLFNDYCFPLCLEIAWHFKKILIEQEDLIKKKPSAIYPEYTHGTNLLKYLRFAKLIAKRLNAVMISHAWTLKMNERQRWLFALQSRCWLLATHTRKTQQEMLKEVRGIDQLCAIPVAFTADDIVAGKLPHALCRQANQLLTRYCVKEPAFEETLTALSLICEG